MPHFRYYLQLPNIVIDQNRNLKFLYVLRIMRDIINQFGLFFLPVYLFQIGQKISLFDGYGLDSIQKGMITIALFFLAERGGIVLTSMPIGKLISATGFTKTIFFSYLVRLGFFTLLALLDVHPQLFMLAGLLEGIQANMFWPSYFTLFDRHSSKSKLGKDLGFQQFFLQLCSVFMPAVSGFVAFQFGFPILYGLVGIFSLISLIIILGMNVEKTLDQVSWEEFISWLKIPIFLRFSMSSAGRYLNDAILFLWPLYVFFVLGNIEKVGYLYTFSLFLALLAVYFVGVYIDRVRSKKSFFFSGGFLSLIWVLRTQRLSVWGIAFVDAIDKLLGSMHWMFFDAMSLRNAKGSQALSYFVYREIITSVVGVIFWLVFAVFFWYNQGWNALFIAGGIGVLLTLLISDHRYERS